MMRVGTGGVAPALELLPSIGNICLAAVFYKQTDLRFEADNGG